MEYKSLGLLENSESVERPVLVAKIVEETGKNNKTYVTLSIMDGVSVTSAKMWDTSVSRLSDIGIFEGSVADAKITRRDYNNAVSYNVDTLRPSRDTSLTVDNFIKTPPIDCSVMFDEIVDILRSAEYDDGEHIPLDRLAIAILEKFKKDFMTSSAAVTMHHNMKGGLIYHTYRMVKSANALCDIYTNLDRELLLCGTALHDIGKIWEYSTSVYGDAEFTINYALFGHLYQGASLIKKFSSQRDENGKKYSDEKVMLLVHMILSHHGTPEFGAVKAPAIPEAFMLHYIDNIDAKMDACDSIYATLSSGEMTAKKPFGLDNRIYKPRFKK